MQTVHDAEVAPAITVRCAEAEDQDTIRQMVRHARLDPTSLHWSHFVVAVDQGQVIGIGQIRPYPGCPELGSMVVLKPYRNRGVGGQIIRTLQESHLPPIYLEARSIMEPYYARFGFSVIPWYRAPFPLSFKAGIGTLLGKLVHSPERVIVMRWDGTSRE